ncbi:MAG: bifunctional phosphoglucose/phosphomannose isomerase [Candidatus Saccharimonadales bacterium]
MLDDLKKIHQADPEDALGIAAKQTSQLNQKFDLDIEPSEILNIVVAGMGGSALAAMVARSWLDLSVPFEIVRGYNTPAYVGKKTLFIASSYSGNTEETLSVLERAEQLGAIIVVVAAGGKLEAVASEKGYLFLRLPAGFEPRQVFMVSLKALLRIFDGYGLTEDSTKTLTALLPQINQHIDEWLPTVATKDNLAKQIALECIGRSVVIYAGPVLAPAAYKWKIAFNENAKQVAWFGQYPEFNHNEFTGWTKQPVVKPYAVIDLLSSFEHPRIQKRMAVSERMLSGKRPQPIKVTCQGETVLEQLLYAFCLGDFVTIYTAILNGVDPTPVELVNKFKQQMGD